MSEIKLERTIGKELRQINERIDMKIIQGVSYRREAKRHKLLLSMLHDLRRKKHVVGPFMRFASILF
jgi:hypothetical protein